MKQRFYLYRRREVYYLQDSRPGKQQSLETTEKNEALRLLEIKRQSSADNAFNQIVLKTCLATQDPNLTKRRWQTVMEQIQTHGKDACQKRCARAMKSKTFDRLRHIKLVETNADDFLAILNRAKVSDAHHLKRLHNLALGLGWLSFPVLAPRLWPRLHTKPKRGITLAEHQAILQAEKNPERSLYYQLLWEIGAAQSDAANLTAEAIDWKTRTLTYFRMKTGERAQLAISKTLERILNQLPTNGPLFPHISQSRDNFRSAEFCRRLKTVGISGVSLHSNRYAWAERAKTCGYPERFARAALGHNSKAVHRAYAKNAEVLIPSLEEFQERAGVLPLIATA